MTASPFDQGKREEASAAAVFDFVAEFLDDLGAESVRPLTDYLSHYPGHEEAIAEEYLRLVAEERRAVQGQGADEERDPGERRVGHYRLLQEVGSGGQGTVYLAEDTRLDRRVAIKLLIGGFVTDDRRRRFRREAESIARLEHPGICHVFEADIDGDTPYIAMQYVEGLDLGSSLAAARAARGAPADKQVEPLVPWVPRSRPELFRVLHFFERAARALHAAHEAGVVHRDIKPGNIVVQRDAHPVLLDFGLALAEEGGDEITVSGEVFGTPVYMSPEQLRGLRDELDRRTDVYSLGIALYEALIGERPFGGADRLTLERAILYDPVPDPRQANPTLTEDVKVVLETALDKECGRRYPTALAFAEDLRRIREYEPIEARPASAALRLQRWVRRQPALATALIGTLILLTTSLTIALTLLAEVRRNLDVSQSRLLSGRAEELARESPAKALALGLEAVRLAPNQHTRSSLFAPLEACNLEHVLRLKTGVRFFGLEFSPDGELVAGVLSDNREWPAAAAETAPGGVLGIWETSSAQLLTELPFQNEILCSVAFHPDGSRVAFGSQLGRLRELDIATGTLSLDLLVAEEPLVALAYAPAGATLAAQDASGVSLIAGGAIQSRLDSGGPRDAGAGRLMFSADGERLLTSSLGLSSFFQLSESSTATLWDVASASPITYLRGHTGPITWSEFDAAGERIVTASADETVRIWDGRTGAALEKHILQHDGKVTCARFSPDGARLATTTEAELDSGAWLWDPIEGTRVDLGDYDDTVSHAAFSPDGEYVVTASFDLTSRMFAVASGALVTEYREFVRPWRNSWSADSKRLLTLSPSPWGVLWRAGRSPDVYRLVGHTGPVSFAAFCMDGLRAITGSRDGTVRIWSTPAAGAAHDTDLPGPGVLLHELDVGGPVASGSVSVDERTGLVVLEDGSVLRIDLVTGRKIGAALKHDAPLVDARFRPDGLRVVTVDVRGRAFLWSLASEPVAVRIAGEEEQVTCAAFAPDGRVLATGSALDEVVIRDPESGEALGRMSYERFKPDRDPGVESLAFHARGATLAAVCRDNCMRMFDVSAREQVGPEHRLGGKNHFVRYLGDSQRVLAAGLRTAGDSVQVVQSLDEPSTAPPPVRPRDRHTDGITSLATDPSGTCIVTGSEDGSALAWDSASGRTLVHFTLHSGEVTRVDLSVRGGDARALSASEDGTACVWPLDPEACALGRKPRELEEWERDREIEFSDDDLD